MIAFSQSRLSLIVLVRYLCGLYFFVFLSVFCTAQSRKAKADVFCLSFVAPQNGVWFYFKESCFLSFNAGNLVIWHQMQKLNSQLFQAKSKGFRTVTIVIMKILIIKLWITIFRTTRPWRFILIIVF